MNQILVLDRALFTFLNSTLVSPLFDPLMIFLSSRTFALIWPVAILTLAAYRKSRPLMTAVVAGGFVLAVNDFVSYEVLKPAFARERPCHAKLEDLRRVAGCGGTHGFPSNHAGNGAVAAVVVGGMLGRPWVVGGWAIAVAVGYSRIYLGVHYPLDVFAGFFVGALTGLAALYLIRRIITRH